MNHKAACVWISFFCCSNVLLGQNNPLEKQSPDAAFQSHYFESLKQKAIENYDKSILELEKCNQLIPNNSVIYFELGKNYLAQKDYIKALNFFEKATKQDNQNKWYWVGMYDALYALKNYKNAIPIVEKLISFDVIYKEDLTSLYMETKQFDKALILINELNETIGRTDKRDLYKADILKNSPTQRSDIAHLLQEIKQNPQNEANYLDLIFLYSKNNQDDQAIAISKQLEQAIPGSDWAQVSLFKSYLTNNEGNKAVKAMNIALQSPKIDIKIKHRILNEFLIFVKKTPEFYPDLAPAVAYLKDDQEVMVTKEVAKFFHKAKEFQKAITYYEMYVKENHADDVSTTLLLFECYAATQQFELLQTKAEQWIDLYPSQPELYYYAGYANNQQKQYKKALILLETGMDFVVANNNLEINFYKQMSDSHNGLGNMEQKNKYATLANQLINKTK
ncbi:cytochrome C biosynthesis protein [Flavobacterium branchiophilum NBRC 15030 = ATCC 35035]|uniref:Tetratricopeptide repeat protein n=1 Tax=Flavobacterium branchiophilum TaxID=55197 RepID=A0A543G2Y1_9FLAO|nr:tetratricopeptide repeat protein [Flavobacterium branchiophilum]OXA72320.1 cytochrome C biosynthesis protein [Flavobacterium branchiophilum NBRC 15030 = ATCC 35035]TQM40450.1 tetratricopeptide repeat protein [Flavobacterium branchiophilum]GEM55597.1 cytochrome c biosynthesis protein [Flavobacterium branchiophilum NBRC 15030 = ATCC 35035]